MAHDQNTLERRLKRYSLDRTPCAERFVDRLARENGWTLARAVCVLHEYRRFLVLSQLAGHPVTPSDAGDQAWHLHLTDSESYWRTLCGEILNCTLHHRPSRGGPSEQSRYCRDYERTLETYESIFGQPPPPDIWPPSKWRFVADLKFRRVNTSENWIVPIPLSAFARPKWQGASPSPPWLRDLKPLAWMLVLGAAFLGASVSMPGP